MDSTDRTDPSDGFAFEATGSLKFPQPFSGIGHFWMIREFVDHLLIAVLCLSHILENFKATSCFEPGHRGPFFVTVRKRRLEEVLCGFLVFLLSEIAFADHKPRFGGRFRCSFVRHFFIVRNCFLQFVLLLQSPANSVPCLRFEFKLRKTVQSMLMESFAFLPFFQRCSTLA